jgi:hypothetical protein
MNIPALRTLLAPSYVARKPAWFVAAQVREATKR